MNAASFLEALGRSSAGAALLAILVIAAQRAFRRQLTPGWSCALWLLVFIRLIPFSAPSPASLQNLLPHLGKPAPAKPLPDSSSSDEAPTIAPLVALSRMRPSLDGQTRAPSSLAALESAHPLPSSSATASKVVLPSGSEHDIEVPFSWVGLLFAAWAIGAAALAAKIAHGALVTRRRFDCAGTIEDPRLSRLLSESCARMHLRRLPAVSVCSAIDSPAVQGVLRPRLLFPEGRLATYTDQELRHILLHELAHVKRRDLALNWLAAALQVLHWFNPLVWYAFHRWRLDREIACDALALSAAGPDQNRAYGRTMLRLVEHIVERRTAPQCIGILEDKNQLRSRLRMILAHKPARRWTLPAILLLGTLAAVGLTDAQPESAGASQDAKALNTSNSPHLETKPNAILATVPAAAHKLSIQVVEDSSGRPIQGALVSSPNLRLPTDADFTRYPRFETDASGYATFDVPQTLFMADQETQFTVQIEHPDYCSRSITWRSRTGHVRESLPKARTVRLRPGIVIGGSVVDQAGNPIAGAKLNLFSVRATRHTGDAPVRQVDENDYLTRMGEQSFLTDADGRWSLRHAPADMESLTIMATRPEGYTKRFMLKSGESFSALDSAPLSRDALVSQTERLAFEAGYTVRGIVTDAQENPMPAVKMSATISSMNSSRHVFTTDTTGHFELKHWGKSSILLAAQSPGHAIAMTLIHIKGDIPDAKLTLKPATPLKIRALDARDTAISGATIALSPMSQARTGLTWSQKTDAAGRAHWEEAPASPLEFVLSAANGAFRTAKLSADGNEQVLRLGDPAERSIAIKLQVLDDDSGAPLPRFETWRQLAGGGPLFWGAGNGPGRFEGSCAITDFNSSFAPQYRIHVRAPGYAQWSSDYLSFTEGDKNLQVRMKRGTARGAATATSGSIPVRPEEDQQTDLSALAAAVKSLMETGDAAAFATTVGISWQNWLSVLPKDFAPKEMPYGPNPEAYFEKQAKRLQASAEHTVAQARSLGLSPGSMRFVYKNADAYRIARLVYRFGRKTVWVPKINAVRLVFEGVPIQAENQSKSLAGSYEFVIGELTQFGSHWRVDRGVRLACVPKPLADERFTREALLLDAIEDTSAVTGRRPLSGPDDQALDELAARCRALLQTRDVEAFVRDLRYSLEGTRTRWANNGMGDTSEVDAAWKKNTELLRRSATEVVEQLARKGIDLAKAELKLRHIVATQPAPERYGDTEGIGCRSARIVFDVASQRADALGKSVDGTYALEFGAMLRLSGRWWNVDGKLRWQDLPASLLTKEERRTLEAENHIADKRSLPAGAPVPNFTAFPLDGDGPPFGAAALRGKIVFVEFWASWCGPCQEPMEKLQKAIAAHPEWKGRVEFLTINIDEKRETGAAHAKEKGWSLSHNAWAGPGGFQSAAATQFRVSGVPTCYLVDARGFIIRGGHPANFDLEAYLTELLRAPAAD